MGLHLRKDGKIILSIMDGINTDTEESLIV